MGFVKATPWSIISFEFMGFLLFLLAVSLAPLPCLHAETNTKKGDCWYILEVKTSSALHWHPGTHNPVRVRFMDIKGSNVTIHPLKDPIDVHHGEKSEPFKYGATAKFNLTGQPCLEEVCSLQFQVQGEDEWRVDYAQVHGESVSRFRCDYHTKLPANQWSAHDRCNPDDQLASTPQELYACQNENEDETGNKNKTGNKSKSKSKQKKMKNKKFLG